MGRRAESLITLSVGVFHIWLERFFIEEGFGLEGAVALLDEHLDLSFGGFQLSFAGGGEAYSLFEELERVIEGKVAFFELIDDGFELFERLFKGWHWLTPKFGAVS